jgi:phage-related baseplate assembly protein
MSGFTAVDISQLPKPDVIQQISFEDIYSEMRDQMNGLVPLTFDGAGKVDLQNAELITEDNGDQYYRIPANSDAGMMYVDLESDPAARQLQIVAYREMLVRQNSNDASFAVMLAYAEGADLEHVGVRFGVRRFTLKAADVENNKPAVYESDDDLRRRIQLSLEGFSTAGPEGAYVFHALNADVNVKDVSAQAPTFKLADIASELRDQLPVNAIVLIVDDSAGLEDPRPGDVAVSVLARDNDGAASSDTLNIVKQSLNADDVRPMTDRVRERSASIKTYQINAALFTYSGPDQDLVISNAQASCQKYVDQHHRLGHDITLSGVYGALHQAGVQRVQLNDFSDIVCSVSEAPYCVSIDLVAGGVAQ